MSGNVVYLTEEEEKQLIYPRYKYTISQPPTMIFLPNQILLLRLMRSAAIHEFFLDEQRKKSKKHLLKHPPAPILMIYDIKPALKEESDHDDECCDDSPEKSQEGENA